MQIRIWIPNLGQSLSLNTQGKLAPNKILFKMDFFSLSYFHFDSVSTNYLTAHGLTIGEAPQRHGSCSHRNCSQPVIALCHKVTSSSLAAKWKGCNVNNWRLHCGVRLLLRHAEVSHAWIKPLFKNKSMIDFDISFFLCTSLHP